MMKTKLLLAALCVLLCAGSCRKEEPPLYKISSEMLSYTAFQKGSWWVYEDTQTKQKDSFHVTEYVHKEDVKYKNLSYRREEVIVRYTERNGAFNVLIIPRGNGTAEFQAGNAHYTKMVLPSQGANGVLKDEKFSMEGPLDSFTVKGKTYNRVYKAIHGDPRFTGNTVKEEYFAPDVGTIKIVFYDSTEWNLVKYHINK